MAIPRILRTRGRPRSRRSQRGQSVTEFALILPLLIITFLAIIDFSRIYTAMLSVESAAREAADYGAYNSSNWIGAPTDPTSNTAKTVVGMTERACVASSNLTDYTGSGGACTNPSMTWSLVDSSGNPATGCDDPNRAVPCRVRVDLDYQFKLIAPLQIDFFNVHLGLPSSLTFHRTSIFAISDFALDKP